MSYKGRHRKPSTAGRTVARVVAIGAVSSLPLTGTAYAHETPSGVEAAIIACESGGNPRAQNPTSTASGLYQFINGTWRAYGGSTRSAKDASVAEQKRVFDRAFAAEGTRPWNASRSCWSKRVGTAVTVSDTAVPVTGARGTYTCDASMYRYELCDPGDEGKVVPYPVRSGERVSGRAANGSGTYVCNDAHLYFEACDATNLGETVNYPLYRR